MNALPWPFPPVDMSPAWRAGVDATGQYTMPELCYTERMKAIAANTRVNYKLLCSDNKGA